MSESHDLQEIHSSLAAFRDELIEIRRLAIADHASLDTLFALGELTGVCMKAKALVGRDIDDRLKDKT